MVSVFALCLDKGGFDSGKISKAFKSSVYPLSKQQKGLMIGGPEQTGISTFGLLFQWARAIEF